MCGIAGFIDFTKKSDYNILKKMTDVLHHRGPNDSGYSFYSLSNYNLGFGHRRLAILDLSNNAHQPMKFGNLEIIYNGEVYNFKEIRRELEKYGYSFVSNSDTEVILKAFHKWGLYSIEKFRGMFSFTIYDSKNEKIYFFRDRVGVKPLYYYINKGIFLYASELKALYEHPNFEKKIDINSLSMYLQFGYIEGPNTIFKNTYKLTPASYIEYNLKTNTFEIKKYWNVVDFYIKDKYKLSYNESQEKLENILIDSFSLRMISDVPVGTFLSGGIDSSLVTAILQKHYNTTINTFTIGFDDEKYNEAHYAKKIANYLGTQHTEHYCSKKDAIDIIPKLPIIYDEPFGDSSAIPTVLVSQIAKQNVDVVLSGDGGDEVFHGYTSYDLFYKRYNFLSNIPFKSFVKNILNFIPDPIMSFQKTNEKFYLKYLKFKDSLEFNDISNMFKISNSVFTKTEILRLLGNYFYQENDYTHNINYFESMMISDFQGYLADDILVKVDRASMSVSLESREPLLDHKIIEFAAQLPIEYKQNKRILKDILSKYIPKELFERKKTGFGIPINDWLRKELKYLIEYYLNATLIEKQNIFDKEYIQNLKSLFLQRKNNDRKIWTILMFQMWYEKNIKVLNG